MSYELFGDDVLFFQRLLKCEGLYTKKLDGLWGRYTEAAANKFYKKAEALKTKIGMFDPRTERFISTLALKAQQEARLQMKRFKNAGLNVKIISGTRSYEEQNALYKKGRFGNPGNIVTKARGGSSNHNFCIAWDIGVFSATGAYLTKNKDYIDVSAAGVSANIEWGGEWKSFPDYPHYQVKTLFASVKQVRENFEKGIPYIA